MANLFVDNFRSIPGVVLNPINDQRLNFPRQTPVKNQEQNTQEEPLVDRAQPSPQPGGIPLLQSENTGGDKFEALEPVDGFRGMMRIWRLDGQPFNVNSYLNSVERVVRDVSSSTDEKSLLDALKRGYNEWGLNNHVLGNRDTRNNGLYDATAATLVKYLYDDIKANRDGDDFETLKSKSINELESQFVPKWMTPRPTKGGSRLT